MTESIDVGCRQATEDDLDTLVLLDGEGAAGIDGVRGGHLERQLHGRHGTVRDSFSDDLSDPQTTVFVGTIDTVVVGLLVLRLTELVNGTRIATVTDLFVQIPARGVGVGERLLAGAVEHATQTGCVGIDARALPGDRATKNFFESFGLVARSISVHRSLDQD